MRCQRPWRGRVGRALLGLLILLPLEALPADNVPPAQGPGLGEYMTTNQLHHAKLWFAGQRRHWALAKYELGELEETLEAITAAIPVFKGRPVAALIATHTHKPIDALGAAIDGHDPTRFRQAFDALTDACNACHRETAHDFIEIQRPRLPPVTNQRL